MIRTPRSTNMLITQDLQEKKLEQEEMILETSPGISKICLSEGYWKDLPL